MSHLNIDQKNVDAAIKELSVALGAEKVQSDNFILSSYTRDAGLFYYSSTRPACVVLPQSRDDVLRIIEIANKYKIPVVTSAARTSCWHANDSNGGIVIDTSNMNRIIDIDTKNLSFTVEAGAGVHHMNKELAKIGFCYPTHPLNFAPISFGSEVSKNSMGEVGGMYGHVAKRLIALEVVLGNGDVLVTGSSRVIKNAPRFLQSGMPDLTQLFVAAEGAYGVITEVTMGMQMLPVAYLGLDMSFEGTLDGFRSAVEAVNELRTRKGIIANAHLIDWHTLWAIERGMTGKKVDKADGEVARQKYGHIAILEIESFVSEEECRLKQEAIIAICKKYGGKYIGNEMAKSFKAGERGDTSMMKILFNEYSPWVCFGSDVPYPNLATFYERCLEIIDRNGWPREKMGHVYAMGDESCLPFFYTLQNIHDHQEVQKAKDIALETLEMQLDLGVVPYRIGRFWRPYVMDKLDPSYLKYIRSLKRQYDPNNIMNRGVSVFEEVYQ